MQANGSGATSVTSLMSTAPAAPRDAIRHEGRWPNACVPILIVDDDLLLAEALAAALAAEGSFDAVGIASDLEPAIRMVAALRPEVVLVNHRLPSGTGLELCEALKLVHPSPAVLLVSASDASDLPTRAVKAQCDGLVSRRAPLQALVAALHVVADGQCGFTKEQLLGVVGGRDGAADREAGPDITARELEILWLLNDGVSTEAIARQLQVSVNTVRTHVRNLLVKFGAHSRLEAIAEARRAGVLDPHDAPRVRAGSSSR